MGSFVIINPWMLCGGIIDHCFGNHMKPTNTLCLQNAKSQMLNFVVYTVTLHLERRIWTAQNDVDPEAISLSSLIHWTHFNIILKFIFHLFIISVYDYKKADVIHQFCSHVALFSIRPISPIHCNFRDFRTLKTTWLFWLDF